MEVAGTGIDECDAAIEWPWAGKDTCDDHSTAPIERTLEVADEHADDQEHGVRDAQSGGHWDSDSTVRDRRDAAHAHSAGDAGLGAGRDPSASTAGRWRCPFRNVT